MKRQEKTLIFFFGRGVLSWRESPLWLTFAKFGDFLSLSLKTLFLFFIFSYVIRLKQGKFRVLGCHKRIPTLGMDNSVFLDLYIFSKFLSFDCSKIFSTGTNTLTTRVLIASTKFQLLDVNFLNVCKIPEIFNHLKFDWSNIFRLLKNLASLIFYFSWVLFLGPYLLLSPYTLKYHLMFLF